MSAEGHEVVPAERDHFALQTTCRAPGCGVRAYWRLGTGVWEHAPVEAEEMTGAQRIALIVDDLAEPEDCTCGYRAPNAAGMETHLRTAHGMGPNAYPPVRA